MRSSQMIMRPYLEYVDYYISTSDKLMIVLYKRLSLTQIVLAFGFRYHRMSLTLIGDFFGALAMASHRRSADSSDSAIVSGADLNDCRSRLKRSARHWIGPKLRRNIDSSDLIQETLLITLSKFSYWLGRPKKEVYCWMVSVLRNRLLTHVKLAGKENNEADSDAIALEMPSKDADLLDALLSQEMRNFVKKELQDYDPIVRDIFELHYFESMPFTEIAKLVKRSPSAVRSIHSRTLKSLKPRMEKLFQ